MMLFSHRPLGTQLTLVFLLAFFAAVSAFGIYDYNSRLKSIKTANLNNILALGKSISASISEDIYTDNFSSIEHKLLSLNEIREIDRVTVYNPAGTILSEVERSTGMQLIPTFRYRSEASTALEKYANYDNNDMLTTRIPIVFSGQGIAWLEILANPQRILQTKREAVRELVTFSLIILVITSLSIITFLNRRLQPLHRLAEFAKKLPSAQGNNIELRHVAYEFKLLRDSLNWASMEIQQQHAELLRQNQTLESRIAERTRESEQARDSAEKASRAKTEFLSRMSHELRTPLNAILGFSQLLDMEKASLNAEQAESVKEIIDAGQHLLSMVNEVLELARIESGRYDIDIQSHELEPIIQETLSLLSPLASAKNICINGNKTLDGSHHISCDRLRTKQVLLNIISNAIKYNRPAGSIDIIINAHQDTLVLSISDTGEGIAQSELEHIFKPFERSESSSIVEGTGIGLAISSELMKAMNGRIEVESALGIGSTFRLHFQTAQ